MDKNKADKSPRISVAAMAPSDTDSDDTDDEEKIMARIRYKPTGQRRFIFTEDNFIQTRIRPSMVLRALNKKKLAHSTPVAGGKYTDPIEGNRFRHSSDSTFSPIRKSSGTASEKEDINNKSNSHVSRKELSLRNNTNITFRKNTPAKNNENQAITIEDETLEDDVENGQSRAVTRSYFLRQNNNCSKANFSKKVTSKIPRIQKKKSKEPHEISIRPSSFKNQKELPSLRSQSGSKTLHSNAPSTPNSPGQKKISPSKLGDLETQKEKYHRCSKSPKTQMTSRSENAPLTPKSTEQREASQSCSSPKARLAHSCPKLSSALPTSNSREQNEIYNSNLYISNPNSSIEKSPMVSKTVKSPKKNSLSRLGSRINMGEDLPPHSCPELSSALSTSNSREQNENYNSNPNSSKEKSPRVSKTVKSPKKNSLSRLGSRINMGKDLSPPEMNILKGSEDGDCDLLEKDSDRTQHSPSEPVFRKIQSDLFKGSAGFYQNLIKSVQEKNSFINESDLTNRSDKRRRLSNLIDKLVVNKSMVNREVQTTGNNELKSITSDALCSNISHLSTKSPEKLVANKVTMNREVQTSNNDDPNSLPLSSYAGSSMSYMLKNLDDNKLFCSLDEAEVDNNSHLLVDPRKPYRFNDGCSTERLSGNLNNIYLPSLTRMSVGKKSHLTVKERIGRKYTKSRPRQPSSDSDDGFSEASAQDGLDPTPSNQLSPADDSSFLPRNFKIKDVEENNGSGDGDDGGDGGEEQGDERNHKSLRVRLSKKFNKPFRVSPEKTKPKPHSPKITKVRCLSSLFKDSPEKGINKPMPLSRKTKKFADEIVAEMIEEENNCERSEETEETDREREEETNEEEAVTAAKRKSLRVDILNAPLKSSPTNRTRNAKPLSKQRRNSEQPEARNRKSLRVRLSRKLKQPLKVSPEKKKPKPLSKKIGKNLGRSFSVPLEISPEKDINKPMPLSKKTKKIGVARSNRENVAPQASESEVEEKSMGEHQDEHNRKETDERNEKEKQTETDQEYNIDFSNDKISPNKRSMKSMPLSGKIKRRKHVESPTKRVSILSSESDVENYRQTEHLERFLTDLGTQQETDRLHLENNNKAGEIIETNERNEDNDQKIVQPAKKKYRKRTTGIQRIVDESNNAEGKVLRPQRQRNTVKREPFILINPDWETRRLLGLTSSAILQGEKEENTNENRTTVKKTTVKKTTVKKTTVKKTTVVKKRNTNSKVDAKRKNNRNTGKSPEPRDFVADLESVNEDALQNSCGFANRHPENREEAPVEHNNFSTEDTQMFLHRRSKNDVRPSKDLDQDSGTSTVRSFLTDTNTKKPPSWTTRNKSVIYEELEDHYVNIIKNGVVTKFKYFHLNNTYDRMQDGLKYSDPINGCDSNVTTVIHLSIPPKGTKTMHVSRHHTLFYTLLEGQGRILVENKVSTFLPKNVVIIPKGVGYALKNDSKEDDMVLSCFKIKDLTG